MAGTEQRMRLDPTTTMLTLTHLLPRCEYWLHVEVFSSGPAPVVSNECYVTSEVSKSVPEIKNLLCSKGTSIWNFGLECETGFP